MCIGGIDHTCSLADASRRKSAQHVDSSVDRKEGPGWREKNDKQCNNSQRRGNKPLQRSPNKTRGVTQPEGERYEWRDVREEKSSRIIASQGSKEAECRNSIGNEEQ